MVTYHNGLEVVNHLEAIEILDQCPHRIVPKELIRKLDVKSQNFLQGLQDVHDQTCLFSLKALKYF